MEELAVYQGSMTRRPQEVLEEAKTAAKALGEVVAGKKKPVIIQGEQYLEFEDWQTVGRFYGITAKIINTNYIQYGDVQGFEARAVAIRVDGQEVSGAEAMCLNDETNWKGRPLFMLRSMAQTRACAKALRNVLAWVVVLAGYHPTPAEEMQELKNKEPLKEPQKKANGEAKKEDLKLQVTIKDVSLKTGTGSKGGWTLYKITTNEDLILQTFDTKCGDLAVQEKGTGMILDLEYQTKEFKGKDGATVQGKEIVSLTRAERDPGVDG